jgi:hypothetical protein
MQTELLATAAAEVDANHVDEQIFSQWASKRLALYQAMEQQAQVSIAQIMQGASELTVRMEAETTQLLERYRQEREAQQAQAEALRQELDTLRAQIAQERQAHAELLATQRQQEEERLAQQRQQEEERLAQQRQQASAEIEKQLTNAKAERAQILNAAHAERDSVVAETRRLSVRLAELQQALQSLLGVVPAALETKQPAPAVSTETTRLSPVAPLAEPAPMPRPTVVVPTAIIAAEENGSTAGDDAELASLRLIVEDVKSFTSASDLIDRLEQSQTITDVNLLQYEEETLLLSVRQIGDSSVKTMIENDLSDALEMVEMDHDTIRLRSRL